MVTFEDFAKIDIRVGKVISDEDGHCVLVAPDEEVSLGGETVLTSASNGSVSVLFRIT